MKVQNAETYLKRNGTGIIWKIFRFLLLIGICYIFLFPVIYMLSVAVRGPDTVNDPSVVWIPREFSLDSIKTAIDILEYPRAITATLIIAVASTVGSLISCSLAGYGFARFKFREKNIAFALVMLTIIVPPQTTIISSFVNYRNFDCFGILKLVHLIFPSVDAGINLINTPWTFILPAFFGAGLRAGLFIYIFRQFFAGMPKDLEEAAMIDGCGALRTFVQVMLPLAKSAFITVLLFSFVWHWNDYYLSMMYNMDNKTLAVMVHNIQDQVFLVFGEANGASPLIFGIPPAACLLFIIPPVVIYMILQRKFMQSIDSVGIVG